MYGFSNETKQVFHVLYFSGAIVLISAVAGNEFSIITIDLPTGKKLLFLN